MASIGYKLDGAATYTTYAGPLSLADGTHTVVFRAIDVAGNVEADTTATIKVDTQLPIANMSQTGQGQPDHHRHRPGRPQRGGIGELPRG